jgi:uncharacterized repeat protein (TIGR01451 family)
MWMLTPAGYASQDPIGCNANNLNVNVGVNANNVTNGTLVTWVVTVQNPTNLAGSCSVTLGPQGLYFICPGPDGNPTGTKTTLIPGGTTLQPGFGLQTFNIQCLVNVSGLTAVGEVSAPGSVVHKNPLQDDPANVDKTISVNVFRPCLTLSSVCNSAINADGSSVSINYSGTLTNCGNVLLQNVTVFADQPSPGTLVFGPITLNAFSSTNFSASYSRSDNLCGPFVTVLSGTGTAPLDQPVVLTVTSSSQCTIAYKPAISVTKTCPPGPVQPGDLLTISGVVSNAGNIALNNVTVVNNKPAANTVLLGPITLAVGQVVPYTGSYAVPPDSCPPYADTVVAQGTSICGGTQVSSQASASCPGTNSPSISVTRACPANPVPPGGTLTYTGTVTNTGNITLNNVTVVSDKPAANTVVYGPATLAPGAGATFAGSYVVPADSCGPYTNTLVASGRDKCFSVTVSSTVTEVCPGTSLPGIKVTKVCPTTLVQPGGTLNYSGTVANTGNVTLNNVTVQNGSTIIYGPATLAPNAQGTFNSSYAVPADSCPPYVDTLVAQGTSRCGDVVTDSTTVPCPGTNTPAIRVTKACPANPVAPGDLLVYSGTVTNTGNVTLTNVTVVNNVPVANTVVFGPATLAPGKGAIYTGSYTVPLDSCGPYTDSVVASGADKCFGRVVTASATTSCPGVSSPGISITEQCPPTPTPLGQTLTFTATVINTGNITLTNVLVVNDVPAAGTVVLRAPALAPGAVTNFTGSFTVPATLDACEISNNLKVTAQNKCNGASITNAVATVCPVVPAPSIHITKICPTTPVSPGGLLTFGGTVVNTGNNTLSNIVVVVNLPASGTVVYTAASLAPGATANFTGSYTAPLDACSVTDTLSVSAMGRCGTPVTDSTTTTCPILTTPLVTISRTCPAAAVAPGSAMGLQGWVTNAGNVTLTNVIIVVDQPVANTPVLGPVNLAPGDSIPFSGSFIVPTNLGACSITSTLTVSGNSKCTGVGVSAPATASCPVISLPRILVTKSCPSTPTPQGGTLVFTGTVANIGNIALTNIVVLNDQPASNTVVFTALRLAPGQVTNFTAHYIVPTNCCSVTDTLTASGNNECDGVTVYDTSTAVCPVQFTPLIKVTKTCPALPTIVGKSLVYSGTVSNAGNVTLQGIVVYNSISGSQAPILEVAALAPGEVQDFSADFVVPPDFCEPDTVTATGTSICGTTVTDSVTSACPVVTEPGIEIIGLGPAQPVSPGQIATFVGMVTNAGNVTLTNVIVVGSMPIPNTTVLSPVTLAPGQATNFTQSYLVQDCDCCQVVNTYTGSGWNRCASLQVVATSTIVTKYLTHPAITIALQCPSGAVAGQTVIVSGTVTNIGDCTLTNVVVVTDTGTHLIGPINLARGEMEDFITTYTVGGTLRVVATANDACTSAVVTSSASCGQPIAPPSISSPSVSGGSITLTWTASLGATYRVQSSTSIANPVWVDEPGDVLATSTSSSKTLLLSPGKATVYYRIMVVHN